MKWGFSDDGEPSGTAGKPILAQLSGSGVGEITAVVTRYSGGIKLGEIVDYQFIDKIPEDYNYT